MSKELIIMSGLPRSGKTEYTKTRSDCYVIELDAVRKELTGVEYDEDSEPIVWDIARNRIVEAFDSYDKVLIDESNPNILHIIYWMNVSTEIPDLKFTVVKVTTDSETCISRTDNDNLKSAIVRKSLCTSSVDELKEFCNSRSIELIIL